MDISDQAGFFATFFPLPRIAIFFLRILFCCAIFDPNKKYTALRLISARMHLVGSMDCSWPPTKHNFFRAVKKGDLEYAKWFFKIAGDDKAATAATDALKMEMDLRRDHIPLIIVFAPRKMAPQ